MNLGIDGRTALVGASSRGLGRAAATALATAGCRVTICGRQKEDVDEAAQALHQETGADVHGVVGDLATQAGVREVVRSAQDRYGTVDILVNNNGGPPPGSFEDMDEDAWRDAFELTFMSTVRLYEALLPSMKAQQWGRIINIASLSVFQPIDNLILSNAIRMGVQGLAKSLSFEVAADNVTINSVCPGFTRTERVEGIVRSRAESEGVDEESVRQMLGATTAVGRIGEPHEVGEVVAFLASEQAAFVTGTAIPVAGGAVRASV